MGEIVVCKKDERKDIVISLDDVEAITINDGVAVWTAYRKEVRE